MICCKMLVFINKRGGGTRWPLYCCSNCRNYSYSAHKTLCTQSVWNAYFMVLIFSAYKKIPKLNLYPVEAKSLKNVCKLLPSFHSVTSHFIQL